MRYKLAKYKKGQLVSGPDGDGRILDIHYLIGHYWYSLKEHSGFYRESELKGLNKKGD